MIPIARTFRALRHRSFRLFFVGQTLSNIGSWLQQVAMGWVTYEVSQSAFVLGLVAFCGNAGFLILSPFAGALADRVNRRRALLLAQTLMLAQAVALALIVGAGRTEVWHLVVLSLWLGIVWSFDVPLRQALYVHLVDDRADLGNAIALNSMMVNMARVFGPALAGVLLAVIGEAWCFGLNAASFLVVLGAIVRIRWPAQPRPATHSGLWESWLEGARYTFRAGPMRSLLFMLASASWTVSPYSTLMPIYAREIFGGGPETLGLLLAAAGFGALSCSLYVAGRTTVRGLPRAIATGALLCASALAAFAYLSYLPAAVVLLAVVGGTYILTSSSVNVILQTIADDRLRGRVGGFYVMSFIGIAPLGNLAAGALAGTIGVQATLLLNGALCATAAIAFWRALPRLERQIEHEVARLASPEH